MSGNIKKQGLKANRSVKSNKRELKILKNFTSTLSVTSTVV